MRDRILTRIWACGEWQSLSALHIGGEEGMVGCETDMPLLRDASGGFYIPAASLAGASRHALSRRYAGSYDACRAGKEPEPAAVKCLFGEKYASLLVVRDAPLVGTADALVRDGVRIEGGTGLAFDGAKFDFEVLPTGSRFRIEFILNLYEELPGELRRDQLLGWFRALLECYQEDRLSLGARTRRGFGRGAVRDWSIRELRMQHRPHLLAWMRRQYDRGDTLELPAAPAPRGEPFFQVEADLRLKTSLLIRSAGARPGDPDSVHLTEQGRALLTGTSLAGALRHRCERIANTLHLAHTTEILASLFGPLSDPDRPENKLRGGRLWVSESVLANGESKVQGRVALDRFTGGARESALFEEAPFWPGGGDEPHVRIRVGIEAPRPCDQALLLLAIKDLWLGDLPLGGEAGGGRGVFAGLAATFTSHTGARWNIQTSADDSAAITCTEGDWDALDHLVAALPEEAANWRPADWEQEAHYGAN
jgi:CRISPR/Cas system CSM-associated protein Csm3 (group 7 of RAMP superfamily)